MRIVRSQEGFRKGTEDRTDLPKSVLARITSVNLVKFIIIKMQEFGNLEEPLLWNSICYGRAMVCCVEFPIVVQAWQLVNSH